MSSAPENDLLPLPQLQTRFVGKNIHYFPETDSTNTRALEARSDGDVFIAEHQTAGRGRHGRRWHSGPGLGLWFSVSLSGPLPGLSFAAALAVRDAVADTVPLSLCWPNDLYAAGRKVCGILVEQRNDWFALGIGLNVNHERADFPAALRHRAGSLSLAAGRYLPRAPLFGAILERLDLMVARVRGGDCDRVREDWVAACAIIGKRIRRGAMTGQVTAVAEDGALLVNTHTGLRRVTCGDVSVVGSE